MTRADLLLAIDGGGTKTQALVTDLEGKVLARGLGPSSNLHSVGFEAFARALEAAGATVRRGAFREHMEVESVNDGPVTLWIDGATL